MSERIIVHPAAEISPLLQGDAFDAFCDVIKRFGQIDQLDPIVGVRVPEADGKFNGTIAILSGRTKLEACKLLGLKPKIEIYAGRESPAELAACLNVLRPQLTTSQLAAGALELEEQFAKEARERQKAAGGDRKSLLVKLPKAIEHERQVGGKTLRETSAELEALPLVEIGKLHKKLFNTPPGPRNGPTDLFKTLLIQKICDRIFGFERSASGQTLVSGKTRTQMRARLNQMMPGGPELTRMRELHTPWLTSRETSFEVIDAILDRMYGPGKLPAAEQPGEDAEAVHARVRAAKICGVSATYVGWAKTVRDADADLFKQLLAGATNLSKAMLQIKRRRSLESMAPLVRRKVVSARRAGDKYQLIHGDCLNVLRDWTLDRPTVIFADPPYNNGWHYDADPTGDHLSDRDYIEWDRRWMALCAGILADNGSMFVLIDDRYSDHFGVTMRELGLHRRNTIIWWENFPNHTKGNYSRAARFIHYYTKSPRGFIWHPPLVESVRNKIEDARGNPDGKIPDNVWPIARVPGNANERAPFVDMPPQLPLEVSMRCILAASEPGDLVLDPFNGNGTTVISALLTGREAVGIDRSAKYLQQSEQWINKTLGAGVPAHLRELVEGKR